MPHATRFTAAAALAVCAFAGARSAAQRPLERISFKVDALKNTVDGTELRGCLVREDLGTAGAYDVWVAFGAIASKSDGEWEAITPRMECGRGTFDNAGRGLFQTFGTPYLITDIRVGRAASEPRSGLAVSATTRRLSSVGGDGRPRYDTTARERRMNSQDARELVVPVLFADTRETSAFGVYEVFVRLTAQEATRKPPPSYGSISVTSDMPGLDIYVDGGRVGRTGEGSAVLDHLVTGAHEVIVRDVSGREVRTTVDVRARETAAANLDVLNVPVGATTTLVSVGVNSQGSDEFWRAIDGALMVGIPAGEFLMGSADGKGEAHERPQHRVFVPAFRIDKTEVTWRQFRRFAKATGAALPPAPIWGVPDDYPVVNVQWAEAKTFCEWAGGRLPTEAEWEKAARGTDGREFPYGDVLDIDRCNTEDGGPHRPLPVASFPGCVSPYGVLDMAGSAREWVEDWYVRGYAHKLLPQRSEQQDPNRGRVIRGGGWMNMYPYQRAASRFGYDPAGRNEHVGLRCAMDAPK